MNLVEIAQLLGSHTDINETINGVAIDSRMTKPGNLFIALRGERFDGHDFVSEAVSNGAIAIICERLDTQVKVPQFQVADTLKALAAIASYHRQTIQCPIIALTGSNGKTTVKEMIAAILPPPSHATVGNFNNHIGAPLSVLQLQPIHRYAVFELGANHSQEIAYTVSIVKPHIALINNIAPAHIEGFGSIDGVAKAKGEIYQGLPKDGIAIVNDDDAYANFWNNALMHCQVFRFSLHQPKNFYTRHITYNEQGCARFTLVLPDNEIQIQLRVPGEHSIYNALAAAVCCYAAGIDAKAIQQGLNAFCGVKGRMTFLQGKNDSIVIDDTYNANLRSVLTAVSVLARRQGRRILVLGDMGELGQWATQHHEEIGHAAHHQGIDLLMTCGKHSELTSKAFGHTARHYTNQDELAHDLLSLLDNKTTVLVKGSRSSAMEKIVQQLVG